MGEDGVKEMIASFDSLLTDTVIHVLSGAIDEILYGSCDAAGQQGLDGPASLSKKNVIAILREQLSEFSTEAFQKKVLELREASLKGSDEHDDCFHLEGRAELALGVQRKILPKYGLEGSRKGVHEMVTRCSQYIVDPEVAWLNDAINMKLGMSPAACKRFRARMSALPPCHAAPGTPTSMPSTPVLRGVAQCSPSSMRINFATPTSRPRVNSSHIQPADIDVTRAASPFFDRE